MAAADNIADLEAILNSGGSRVTTDGLTVQFDLDQVRRRLNELKAQQDVTKRPKVAGIDLSSAF